MMEPFPAESGLVEPQYGSHVASKRIGAALTVFPISKQLPVLLKLPVRYQRS
jgi:hypothetical protein